MGDEGEAGGLRAGEWIRDHLGRPAGQLTLRKLLSAFYLHLRAENRSPATLRWYEYRLGRLLAWAGDVKVVQLERVSFRHWLLSIERGQRRPVSAGYVESHRKAAAALMNFAVDEDFAKVSPLENLGRYKQDEREIEILTPEEFLALVATQPLSTFEGRRNRVILALLYDTGIRVGELVSVTIPSVRLDERELRVSGKARRERAVPMSPKMVEILRDYLERVRPPVDVPRTVFVSAEGTALSTNGVDHWMANARRAAGIVAKKVTPHTFRHTFSTNYLRAGGNPLKLKKILGHRSMKMVDRYVHFVAEDLHVDFPALSPLERLGQ